LIEKVIDLVWYFKWKLYCLCTSTF